jgi:hypothetical protein
MSRSLVTAVATVAFALVVIPAEAKPTATQKCESAKLLAQGKFAHCRLKADASFVKDGKTVTRDAAYVKCADRLRGDYGKADGKYATACPRTSDVKAVQLFFETQTTNAREWLVTTPPTTDTALRLWFLAQAAGTADLSGTDLTSVRLDNSKLNNANLAGVNLSQAFLTQTQLSGADLSNVVWSNTLCPDGIPSNINGSNPESCCGHLDGDVPAACSP